LQLVPNIISEPAGPILELTLASVHIAFSKDFFPQGKMNGFPFILWNVPFLCWQHTSWKILKITERSPWWEQRDFRSLRTD